MLRRIPELRWIGVNWCGLHAKVQVSEQDPEQRPINRLGCADLISCADGVITGVEVYNGQALVAPGDAVTEGQALISGLVDLERCLRATRALGEVYAETRRCLTVRTPRNRTIRTPGRLCGLCLWLRVGRKRIKICGSSGIIRGDCVKMINRKTMRLPLGLCVERYYAAQPQETALTEAQAQALFRSYLDRWAAEALVAGRVLSEEDALEPDEDAWVLIKTLHCREMIARSAEIPILELEQHGTNDQRGTNGAAD
jgi:similar to stage IV sporulation protein